MSPRNKKLLGAGVVLAICVPLAIILPLSQQGGEEDLDRDYRQDMRFFVQNISAHARVSNPAFVVIPQNGHELVTTTGEPGGPPASTYLAAISGVGREDLFYGYDQDDSPTPASVRDRMVAFIDVALGAGVVPLVTNYCSDPAKMDDAYAQCASRGYLSFSADHRELDDVPAHPATPYNATTADVTTLAEARNFLYLLNPAAFASKAAYLAALQGSGHDVLIVDAFDGENQLLTPADVTSLKTKPGGGSRLVVSYMSIGEAEDYRDYWNATWAETPPAWLAGENPAWQGNYKVRYWDPAWQAVIFGQPAAYLDRIVAAGFDGTYLDIIDAYEYFE